MSRELVTRLRLQPGETLHLPLDARTTLQVLRGAAVLHEAPAWLGERMLAASSRLAEGQAHRVAQPGWLRIEAQAAPVEILCRRAPAWTAVAWQTCALQVAAWRQGLRRFATRH